MSVPKRCGWVANASELDRLYHDEEWGVPIHDDHRLFEALTLEGAQAGLSWSTILKKREGYRSAFAQFDIAKVARYGPAKVEKLLGDPGIVRNRLKVASTVSNAKAVLAIQKEYGSFDTFIWSFVNGESLQPKRKTMADVPSTTEISDTMSKTLKRHGFRFVGSTICYAFMQAVGLVNDHETGCFRYKQLR